MFEKMRVKCIIEIPLYFRFCKIRLVPKLDIRAFVVVVALLFDVHGKHLRSCRDGQLT